VVLKKKTKEKRWTSSIFFFKGGRTNDHKKKVLNYTIPKPISMISLGGKRETDVIKM
jgi:hypothetical protein